MSLKRTATIVVGGGVLAAWLSAAMTPDDRARAPVAAPQTSPLESSGAELASEIARLRERLRPDAAPRAPGRDLFSFRRSASPAVPSSVTEPLAEARPPQPAAVPAVPLKLVGIAEDAGPSGAVRTAIIHSEGQLHLVKEGENVTAFYRVTKVSGDAVELTDTRDGAVRRLYLK